MDNGLDNDDDRLDAFVQTQLGLIEREHQWELREQASFLTPLLHNAAPPSASASTTNSWSLLQRRGTALLDLAVTSLRSGLGGKTVADFERSGGGGGAELPPHRLRVGDIVMLVPHVAAASSASSGASGKGRAASSASTTVPCHPSGVVSRIKPTLVSVAVSGDAAEEALEGADLCRWRVVLIGNEVSFTRMKDALRDVQAIAKRSIGGTSAAAALSSPQPLLPPNVGSNGDNASGADGDDEAKPNAAPRRPKPVRRAPTHHSEARDLIDMLIVGRGAPQFDERSANLQFFEPTLNASQREAVSFALSARHVALIHGPPGTGKTHTLVELVRQLVLKRGERVLVCGPSNVSVDTLAERLAAVGLDIARTGHPARVKQALLDHSLEVRVRNSDEGQLVKDVRTDLDAALGRLRKARRRADKRELHAELKLLRTELRDRERTVVDTIVRNAQVVLSTLSGCMASALKNRLFDTVIIDESSQAIEAESWLAIVKGKRVVLAGDHLQLPPTVKSEKGLPSPGTPSLQITLFDRLLKAYGNSIKRMLNVQYRMHESIMAFPSKQLYGGKLIAHDSVKAHLLSDLPGVEATEDTTAPLLFFDTSTASHGELADDDDPTAAAPSLHNPGEAALVVAHVRALVAAGLAPSRIAIVSPYAAQTRRLALAVAADPDLARGGGGGVEVATVDALQGAERDAVVLSLVRSNARREVGFLRDVRRLNVAMTRARRQLAVIGDGRCLAAAADGGGVGGGGGAFLKRWVEFLEEVGEVRYVE